MGIFDTLGGGSSYYDEDEDQPQFGYRDLETGHPLISDTPVGALPTEDVGAYYGGSVPGAPGFEGTGYGGMAWEGVKEGLFAPLAGIAERLGFLDEGTRMEMREEFERRRLEFLSEKPGIFRTVVAGASEIAPSLVPYAPAGTVGKLATTIAPRAAKYGLQGTRLADPKFLARGLAATGGAGIGLGETTGGTVPEQLLGLGLGAGLGSLAGKLDIPEHGIIDKIFREDGIIDTQLGPSSGFRPMVEEARKSAAYKAGAREQEALFELNIAKAHADEAGLSRVKGSETPDYTFIEAALTDRAQLAALKEVNPVIGEAVENARRVLDDQSEILIRPGGKVYENFQRQVADLEDEFGIADQDEIMDFIMEDVKLLEPEDISSLPPKVQQAYKTGALINTIQNNRGEYLTRVYQAFSDPSFAQSRFRLVDDIKAGNIPDDMDAADADRLVKSYDTMINSIIHDKNGKLKPYYADPVDGIKRAERKLFGLMDRSTLNAAAWGQGKMPKTEWGTLQKRRLGESTNDRALRNLLGEDEDVFRGMARTVRKITADQEAYTFKKTLADDLVARGEASRTLEPGSFDYEITQLREAGLPPVYVKDPKLAAELGEISEGMQGGILDAVNYLSKAMATVMNPVTHARNILANPTFLVYGGINPLEVLKVGNMKDARQALRALDKDPAKALTRMTREELDEFREASFAMMERGMLENVDVSDLRSFHEGIARKAALSGKTTISDIVGNVTDKVTRSKMLGNPAKKYAYEDFFFKNMGYQAKKRQWEAMDAGFTKDQVKELTLNAMDKMLPTYSRKSKLTEKFRRAQFIAPFVNFYSELVRTAKQGLQQATRQVADPDGFLEEVLGIARGQATEAQKAAVRRMGAKQMGGIAGVAALPLALQQTSKIWNGITDEEEAASREFMAPWDKRAPVAYTSKEPGKFSFVNLGYLFPHAALMKPSELAGPFFSPSILVSEAFEGYKELSRSSELSPAEKAKIVGKRGFRALGPGFLKWGERIAKGASGLTPEDSIMRRYFPNENRYGKQYSLTKELMAPLGRPTDQDVTEGLRFKATSYSRGVRQAKDIVNDTKNQSPDRTIDAITKATSEHRALAERFIDQIDKARLLGSTDEEITSMLKELGTIPKADVKLMMKGIVPPFRAPRWTQNG